MVIGYSGYGLSREGLLLYCDMVGRAVRAQIVKSKEELDQVVYNAILRLFSERGRFNEVLHVFEEMHGNSLIAGFVRRDHLFEALDAFRSMQGEGVGFSWATLPTMLPVC